VGVVVVEETSPIAHHGPQVHKPKPAAVYLFPWKRMRVVLPVRKDPNPKQYLASRLTNR
jgi:hypothetical protein